MLNMSCDENCSVVSETIFPRQKSIFVGGPFLHAYGPNGIVEGPLRSFIELVTDTFALGNYHVLSAHRTERFGELGMPSVEEITRRDFQWTKDCDVYVAILPCVDGKPMRTDGTHMELAWVVAMQKPVVIIGQINPPGDYTPIVLGLQELTTVRWLEQEEVAANPHRLLEAIRELL